MILNITRTSVAARVAAPQPIPFPTSVPVAIPAPAPAPAPVPAPIPGPSTQRKSSLTNRQSQPILSSNGTPLVSVTVGGGPTTTTTRTRKRSGTSSHPVNVAGRSAMAYRPAIQMHGGE